MATLKGLTRSKRGESLSKGLMVDTVRGVLRVRKWPRKYGKPRSPLQAWWCDWFRQANKLAKYVDAASQRRAIQITAGSGMYPRDVLLSAMRGRLYSWVDQTGKVWHSMAAIQDISESLDVLAQNVGSILARAADRWRALDAGDVGEVLTSQGAGVLPEWQPAAGGGGFLGGAMVGKSANQTIAAWSSATLTYNTEAYDTHAIYDPGSPTRLTVPTGYDLVRVTNTVYANAGGGQVIISRQHKNGAEFPGGAHQAVPATSTAVPMLNGTSSPLVVSAGDYFEVNVYNGTASTRTIVGGVNRNWFALELLSES